MEYRGNIALTGEINTFDFDGNISNLPFNSFGSFGSVSSNQIHPYARGYDAPPAVVSTPTMTYNGLQIGQIACEISSSRQDSKIIYI